MLNLHFKKFFKYFFQVNLKFPEDNVPPSFSVFHLRPQIQIYFLKWISKDSLDTQI